MTAAERQQRRRDRLATKREATSAGHGDAELGQAVRDLHARLEYEASQGDARARRRLGGTPAETLANVVQEATG